MNESSKSYGPLTPQIERMGRKQAIDNLVADLRDLVTVESAGDLQAAGYRDETELQRTLSVHMLCAFEGFLRRIEKTDAIPEILVKLTTALNDAESGIEHSLLIPRRSAGSPPAPSDKLNLQGRVAAVQDFLMAKGWTKEKAATLVFRELGSNTVDDLRSKRDTKNSNSPSWRTVDRWRTSVREGSHSVSMGSGFEAMTAILDQQAERDPASLAKQTLSILRKRISPPPPKFG